MELTLFVKALAWTFVHSLWQGLLAAIVAAIIIMMTKRSTANLRYNLLATVMLFFVGAFVFTLCSQLSQYSVATPIETGSTIPTYEGYSSFTENGFLPDFGNWFSGNANYFMLGWMFFFLLNCLKLVTGLSSVHRLRHYRAHPVSLEWDAKLQQLKNRLQVKQTVNLLESELVKVPVAIGVFKPLILLPIGLISNLPPDQLESILLHELAHIRRKDYLVNLIQRIVESIFFFNPALVWVSSLLRQEREACCDDIVVKSTGEEKNYLDALVNFQEYSLHHSGYVMGISSRRHYLLNRVKRLITKENKGLNLPERIMLLAGLLVFSAFSAVRQHESRRDDNREGLLITKANMAFQPVSIRADLQKDIIKINPVKKPVSTIVSKPLTQDTIPGKKDTVTQKIKQEKEWDINKEKSWEIKKEKDWDIEEARVKKNIEDIGVIKDKIGVKKDEIGQRKEQLKTADKTKEEVLSKEIDGKRKEIDAMRLKLELKRDEVERDKRIINERKKELQKEKEKEDLKEKQREARDDERKEALKNRNGSLFNKGVKPGSLGGQYRKNMLARNDNKKQLFNKSESSFLEKKITPVVKADKKVHFDKKDVKAIKYEPTIKNEFKYAPQKPAPAVDKTIKNKIAKELPAKQSPSAPLPKKPAEGPVTTQ